MLKYAEFLQDDLDYLKDAREYFHRFVDEWHRSLTERFESRKPTPF